MAIGEIYIKLVVGFPNDPKVRALARYGIDSGLARDLYVQMCLYCKDNLSDGFVPEEQIGLLVYPLPPEHGNQLAKQLASVRLINSSSKDGADGWQVCAFLKRNASKAEVDQLSQVRAEAGRVGGRKSRKRPAQKASQASNKQVANQGASKQDPRDRDRDRGIQTPTASAGELTLTQRSKRITDAYAEAEPMCKWPAVNGVVLLAIKSERYQDPEILAAVLRLAQEGRSVTIDSLRTELNGFPARRGSPATSDQRVAQAQAVKASLRAGQQELT